jgi:hypothetical protein
MIKWTIRSPGGPRRNWDDRRQIQRHVVFGGVGATTGIRDKPDLCRESPFMTDKTVDLDRHRGMAAQKATDLRRLLADVEANEQASRVRQDELEQRLTAAPAATWQEAADKARYLLKLFGASLAVQDSRKQMLLEAVFADFDRLSHAP